MKADRFDELRYYVALRTDVKLRSENFDTIANSTPGIIDYPTVKRVHNRLVASDRIEKHTKQVQTGKLFSETVSWYTFTRSGFNDRVEILHRLATEYPALAWYIVAPEPEQNEPLDFSDAQRSKIKTWQLPECNVEYMNDADLWGGGSGVRGGTPKWVLRAAYIATMLNDADAPEEYVTTGEIIDQAASVYSEPNIRNTLSKMADAGMVVTGSRSDGPGRPTTTYGYERGEHSHEALATLIRRAPSTILRKRFSEVIPLAWVAKTYNNRTGKLQESGLKDDLNAVHAFAPGDNPFPLGDPEDGYLLGGQNRSPIDSPVR